jgi:hypothetical protein
MKSTPTLSHHARSSEEPGVGNEVSLPLCYSEKKAILHAGICEGTVGRLAVLP